MSADPSSEKKPSALRPLPSVDMALLPDQLRARRTRRLVVGALVGAVVVGSLLFWIAKSVIPQSWSWMEDTLGRQDAKLAADLAMRSYAEDDLERMEREVIDTIYDYAEAQGLTIDTVIQEGGAGQIEIDADAHRRRHRHGECHRPLEGRR